MRTTKYTWSWFWHFEKCKLHSLITFFPDLVYMVWWSILHAVNWKSECLRISRNDLYLKYITLFSFCFRFSLFFLLEWNGNLMIFNIYNLTVPTTYYNYKQLNLQKILKKCSRNDTCYLKMRKRLNLDKNVNGFCIRYNFCWFFTVSVCILPSILFRNSIPQSDNQLNIKNKWFSFKKRISETSMCNYFYLSEFQMNLLFST